MELVFEKIGRPARLQVPPRLLLRAIALFNPILRAVKEQLYQSDRPWIVDSGKFLGWRATPLPEAITATVAWFRADSSRP